MKPLEKSITLAASLKAAVGNVKYIFNIDFALFVFNFFKFYFLHLEITLQNCVIHLKKNYFFLPL